MANRTDALRATRNTRKRRSSEENSSTGYKRAATPQENGNNSSVNSSLLTAVPLCTSALQSVATSLAQLTALQRNPEHEPLANYDLVSIFDPLKSKQSVTRWLSRIEDLSSTFHWTPAMTIYAALSKLGGVARTWYEGLNSVNHTWSEWKELMREAFPQRSFHQRLKEMMARKKRPYETYLGYFHEKLALINTFEYNDKDAVSLLIAGIEDLSVRNSANAGRHQTPWSLISFLCSLDSPDESASNSSARVASTVGSSSLPDASKNKKHLVECRKCGKHGHYAKHCQPPE